MRPRPASRKRPLVVGRASDLAGEILPLVDAHAPPVAVLSGPREWRMLRLQPDAKAHLRAWPGDGETFCGVPVIVRPGLGTPRVMETQGDLEDVLLGDGT